MYPSLPENIHETILRGEFPPSDRYGSGGALVVTYYWKNRTIKSIFENREFEPYTTPRGLAHDVITPVFASYFNRQNSFFFSVVIINFFFFYIICFYRKKPKIFNAGFPLKLPPHDPPIRKPPDTILTQKTVIKTSYDWFYGTWIAVFFPPRLRLPLHNNAVHPLPRWPGAKPTPRRIVQTNKQHNIRRMHTRARAPTLRVISRL